MSYKNCHRLVTLLRGIMILFIVIIVLFTGTENKTQTIIYAVCTLIVGLASAALAYKYLRCPNCGAAVAWHLRAESTCASCGASLYGGKKTDEDERGE